MTTHALSTVSCTSDPQDTRSFLIGILTTPNPDIIEWTTEVGLAGADPNELTLVTDDSICNSLWAGSKTVDPEPGRAEAFFSIGDRYIVTDNPIPQVGRFDHGATAVLDEQFKLVGPILVL